MHLHILPDDVSRFPPGLLDHKVPHDSVIVLLLQDLGVPLTPAAPACLANLVVVVVLQDLLLNEFLLEGNEGLLVGLIFLSEVLDALHVVELLSDSVEGFPGLPDLFIFGLL